MLWFMWGQCSYERDLARGCCIGRQRHLAVHVFVLWHDGGDDAYVYLRISRYTPWPPPPSLYKPLLSSATRAHTWGVAAAAAAAAASKAALDIYT